MPDELPSSSDTLDSYFLPQTVRATVCTSGLVIYRPLQAPSSRAHSSTMSSNASVNLSNNSPAESHAPLPIPPPASPPPAVSPRTVQSTLASHEDLHPDILRAICNGLLSTIAKRETETALTNQLHAERVLLLQRKVLQYEETFNTAPEGYVVNDGLVPNFRIPVGNGLSRPAKWVKINDDGTASGFCDNNGPNDLPHITELYAAPDPKYDEEAEPMPPLPLPGWFRYLLVGPGTDFQLLQTTIAENSDWGLSREIARFRELDNDIMDLAIKLEVMGSELDALHQARSDSESRLVLARAADKAAMLQNVPRKPQAMRSAWKRKSSGRGRPN